MKSRKLGLFGKRTKYRAAAATPKKSPLRRSFVETLEKREMLNADWNPTLVDQTGFFFSEEGRERVLSFVESKAQGGSGGGSGSGFPEGGPNDIVSVSEQEPNAGRLQGQFVPFGSNFGVNIIGNNTAAGDVDWYQFDIAAGDIIDARLTSSGASTANIPILSLYNANNREMVSTTGIPTAPADSPLTGSPTAPLGFGDIALHYVMPTAGRYFMRVSDVGSTYTLQLRKYRPVFEAQPAGTKQILFLDFDGEIVNRNTFGFGPGSARLSPVTEYLAGYGLEETDEARFIDEVVRRTQSKFDVLGINTTNPNYGIEIRNSKDHPDPWGLPNVTRIVVGGTFQELVGDPAADNDIGLLGIAESVDPGNFDTTETALVLNDVLLATYPNLPFSSAVPRLEAIAELMTFVVVHEAGHTFGGWHQDPFNATNSIMDQTYSELISSGAGNDGIFGTADDNPIEFASDRFSLGGQPFEAGGINDVVSFLGWGLSVGQQGGRVNGSVYQDRNLSRTFDTGDLGLAGIRVYTDINGNNVLDSGEFSAMTNAGGQYSLLVAPGSYTVKTIVPAGFRPVAPVGNAVNVSVALDQTIGNINFGHERLDQNFTGIKWNDSNANGLRDAGESPIAGVWIYIDLDGDNRIDIGEPATQTGQDGRYRLQFPGPGTYQIREVIEPGFVQTFPGITPDGNPLNDFEHEVVITGNPAIDMGRIAGLDFGNTLTVDFGDAPATYGIASHGLASGLRLGAAWDAEDSSLFSADATGDDRNGPTSGGGVVDDEDGIVLARPLVRGSTNNRVSVTALNSTGQNAFLNAWIDYNQNGVFDATERIFTNQVVGTGTTLLNFSAPTSALLGSTLARFRYSNETLTSPTGAIASGEVEDYLFNVIPTLEIAVDDRVSVSRNSALNVINVLANDFQLPGETLEVIGVSSTSAGGTVSIAPDSSLRYTPPNGFIGQDVFTYTVRNSGGDVDTASVVVEVNLFFDDPLAIDDSFEAPVNSVDFPMNVLANDIEGQNGALTIISVTQADKGGQVSIATGGQSLRYTPLRDFGGTEFITYTVSDVAGNQSTATVTVHTLPGARADDDVLIRLRPTDLNGVPITAIPQGEMFRIDVIVDDLRFDANNPGTAAGLFAAYADILYNLQLVSVAPSTGGRFNFDVEFFNDFVNGQNGNADVPGIVDEFGAFIDQQLINRPGETRLASITFEARSAGMARFMPDPADNFPISDTLLFDTSSTPVPIERIRYIGASLEIIADGAQFPIAVDDSLVNAIPAGSIQFPIDVLRNDIPGSTGAISLTDVDATSLNGATLRINAAGDRILYTPRTDFSGTDQFRYTIQDSRGIQSSATVTVRVGQTTANDIVDLQLEVTNSAGQSIEQIAVGQQFQLRGYVQDLRTAGPNLGIFAAYQDILYSTGMVDVVASTTNDPNLGFQVQFGPNYGRVREGDIRTDGLINEIGAVSTVDTPLGNSRQLLFVVTLTATGTGVANFIADPADISPLHDTLTFEPVEVVEFDRIRYGADSVTIVSGGGGGGSGEFHNGNNALDVNDDGHVSPIDALLVINQLNGGGSGALGGGGSGGEGENGRMYIDTNNDGYLSPVDALLVINALNSLGGGNGEGEAPGLGSFASMLAGPGVELGSSASEAEAAVASSPEVLIDATNRIQSRLTSQQYGPTRADLLAATDDAFGDSESVDSIISQLAPQIEEDWKKQLA